MLSLTKRCGVGKSNNVARLAYCQLANQSFRYYSDDKCEEKPQESKCGLVLNEYTCGQKPTEPYVPKPAAKQPPLVSMWTIKDCDQDLSCAMDLRYDMKYYSISDKLKRKYQVTWNECPRLLIKPKKVCLYEKMKRPKIERRPRGAMTGGTPQKPPETLDKAKSACVYIKSVCCKTGRRPPKCKAAFPSLGNCEKRKTPYPSYSECIRDPAIPLPPVECGCLNKVFTCDAWAVLRRRVARGLTPHKLCGQA
ncbi:uncharacterized protein LOC6580359 [Drosophila mojavensis]|uniref:Uncharacterized protein n=1 Tax=Drosophila mojavensis TaxID=7230 RepID=B4KPE5_DROMO|nr:uncharacterized protein LOC6580359 [Drosophila mojavensis]EDW10141.1 uncharacterized protein Dmoj_GI20912 [Drosophila mojavensis]